MKKSIFILSIFCLLIGFSSCEEKDMLIFTAKENAEGLTFKNEFSSDYLLSTATGSNIAERFIWEPANFDAPVNVTYELQASLSGDFTDASIIGSTNETNLSITVDEMLSFARDLGLDNDPTTTNEDGTPNNTGDVLFRLRAFTGSDAANSLEAFSEIQPITITWIEEASTGAVCPSFWLIGEAIIDAGWSWDSPVELECEENVYASRANFSNENFRFFETEGDWESGLGYSYFADELGYTIDPLLGSAEDADDNFTFIGTPGIYDVIIDDGEKTITLTESGSYYIVGDGSQAGWNWDNPVELVQTGPYVYTGSVDLNTTGAWRIFTVRDDWDTGLNYPHFEGEGYQISELLVNAEDGDSNFAFTGTEGIYTLTLNEKEQTITLN